jgi:PKD repeat protein
MSRLASASVVLALAIVAILGGGFVSASAGGSTPSTVAVHAPATGLTAAQVGAPLLKEAVASINAGAARSGAGATCSVSTDTAAVCGGSAPPLSAHHDAGLRENSGSSARARLLTSSPHATTPTSPPVSPPASTSQWFNVSANLTTASGGVIPQTGYGGRMAFDPLLDEVILFTGSSYGTDYPFENVTWAYNGITWTNLTASLTTAPSIRWYPGFDYDPAMGGIILVGGWGADDLGLNDTWLFTGTWKNISATTGILRDATDGGGQNGFPLGEGGIGGSGAAWDPALHGFLLTDGCDDYYCDEAYALSWLLNSTGWWTISFGPGWGTDNPVPDYNGTWLGYTVMAWDAAEHYMVLFGGYDYYSELAQNYTYTYSGGVYTGSAVLGAYWDNITLSDSNCVSTCGTPAGRVDEAMTWDAQLGAIFMTGGYNYTPSEYNDSWEFFDGYWYPLKPSAPATFDPVEGPAMAVNSTDIGVFMVGGWCSVTTTCNASEWVYETPPRVTLTEAPTTTDPGLAVTFTAGWVVGTGTGYAADFTVSTAGAHAGGPRATNGQNTSGAYSKAISYAYTTSGTLPATATWSDFFYIDGTSAAVSVTVNPALAATITASATTITSGNAVTFTTSPTGGSGTYTYHWSFGDGTTSTTEAPPAHTYAKAGTYVVNLTVTDSLGRSVNSTVTITVKSASTGFSLSGTTLTYLALGIVALLVVIVAVVLLTRRKKPTSAQPWQGGAPPAGAGGPPSGAMGEAPPPPPPTS